MSKEKKLAELANEAIEAYMTLIAQVDALSNPMVEAMIEPKWLMQEALRMSSKVDEISGSDA